MVWIATDPAERFWRKVDKSGPVQPHTPNIGECWVWTAGKDKDGYGRFRLRIGDSGRIRAHRAIWEMANGPVPDGLHVLHKCDNPSCVNPAHLFLGTGADNTADRYAKGRSAHGERHWKAKLSRADVDAIRASDESGVKLADIYGVSKAAISAVRRGRTWT